MFFVYFEIEKFLLLATNSKRPNKHFNCTFVGANVIELTFFFIWSTLIQTANSKLLLLDRNNNNNNNNSH